MLIPTLAGSVYNFTIVPKRLQKLLKYKNLKDIPTSRDLFAALAWAVLITFTPQAINDDFVLQPASGAIFLWTFFLAYLRSLIFDLRDIEGDRIMGRETLITIIGEIRVKALIFTALFSSLFILICLAVLTLLPDFRLSNVPAYAFLLQIPVLLHVWAFMKYQQNITNSFPALFNLLADGQFYIAGFGAWLISLFGN
jgi:4-hydroxy-3-methylbut-2-enyl diphosphate reductase